MRRKIKAKDLIRNAFAKTLKVKPYYRITVKELTEETGVTRQIFYYYFKNMTELLKYYFEVEIQEILKVKRKFNNFEEAYILFFKSIAERKDVLININQCESCGLLRESFEVMSKRLFELLFTDTLVNNNVKEKDKDFLLNYYKVAFASVAYEWLNNGMKEEIKYLVKNLSILIDQSLMPTLKRFEDR
ncbi:TetR/AcrR family transcriptional regulator [Streptobacillus moniliformis]|uniref:Transcriptional regulator, TetR family n=1 Tax=Streptobacillus moniliformis (strain ATCC 14647 / DSM 12112 / NCTC 10651 / 9901) TaxID=519441 RepID=D1AWM2_STRM9|nr:TetR/AcrR family transcriptional regulator [Streptobacillus moniliformis]ACZ00698.1 transcriptional regulator, TetR family [Streptobacillus moniliformis DSM 12112]AVL42903.1 TetR/AcrR family transcriptional regulator [Streptobacillus moniliformis]QXW65457.1 TetR/AcrR family transcriptional regulator [Streptobacillus moniliformis]SQA14174.1 HTH-type dhaKLM operon transcriptional activator dhaS [Streptobacillus moniliformis]